MKKLFIKARRNFKQSVKGAISILLSMVLLTTFSLGSLVMESGRYQSAKAQLDEANLSAALSMLTKFNTELSESYGLFAFNEDDIKESEYYDYLNFNSDLDKDYYGNNISRLYGTPSAEIDAMYNLTNPTILKRQIMEYSKYNIPLSVGADLLDVEEMIEKLEKELKKAIPALDFISNAADLITELTNALEQLYKLQETIAYMDNCYNGDKSLSYHLTNWVNLVQGEESPTYDPNYVNAYNAFTTAVQKKVDYMKENKAPENPGDYAPYSTSTVNSKLSASNTAKKKLTNKIINVLVTNYEKTSIFGGKETVKVEGDCSTCINVMSSLISDFDNKANDTDKIKSIIKYISKENYNYEIKEWNSSTLSTLKSKLADEPSESITDLNTKYTSAKSSYDSCVSANNAWQVKKDAYDKYQKKIKSFNDDIKTAADNYKSRSSDFKKLMTSYKSYLDKATNNLGKAADAVGQLKTSEEEKKKNTEIFKQLNDIVNGALDQVTNTAITYLDSDIVALGNLVDNLDDIDSNYSVTSKFKSRNLKDYYMSTAQAMAFVTAVNSIKAIDQKVNEITAIFGSFKDLVTVFSGLPYISDLDCNATISGATWNILPSKTGPVADDVSYPSDETEIEQVLSEAKTMLKSSYSTEISKVSPTSRNEEADIASEIDSRLETTIEAIEFFTKNTGVLTSSIGLFAIVFQLKPMIDNAITLVDNITFFANNISATIEIITQSLYENVILNSYITDKFPNRVDRDDKSYKGYEGVLGIIPDGDVTAFKAACVEYILSGKQSEILNQNSVFWKIFLVRFLMNMVVLAADESVQPVLTACNVFAIIVLPLWSYFETNIDMNILLKTDDGEVPLIKLTPILSVEGLTKMAGHLDKMIEDIENAPSDKKGDAYKGAANKLGLSLDELLSDHGTMPLTYSEYLWLMLLLTSNKTKVTRIADLIQMDMRYQEVYSGKGSGTATFLMSDMKTFIRVKATANFNSILPIIAMGKQDINDIGIKVKSTKYVGY